MLTVLRSRRYCEGRSSQVLEVTFKIKLKFHSRVGNEWNQAERQEDESEDLRNRRYDVSDQHV